MVDKTVEEVVNQAMPGLWGLMFLLFCTIGATGILWLIWFLIALLTDPATAVYYFQ